MKRLLSKLVEWAKAVAYPPCPRGFDPHTCPACSHPDGFWNPALSDLEHGKPQ